MRRFKRWLDPWLMVVLCCIYLAMSVVVIPLGIQASHDEGTFGTFTAGEERCGRRGCEWIGEFESDDGSIRRDRARYDS